MCVGGDGVWGAGDNMLHPSKVFDHKQFGRVVKPLLNGKAEIPLAAFLALYLKI